ncbi:MAG: DUF3500 domain-containing protein [Bryobacteraceae bacterium]|nr:DUF3500 domain-containing protein [Bryobacteraceae bacterium]
MPMIPDRRQFLKTAAVAPLALATDLQAAKAPAASETLVTTLYKSLNEEQKKKLLFAFDDPLRWKVDNNWFITPVRIGGQFFTADQQAMVSEIFRGLYNPAFWDKVAHQLDEDAKGLKNCSCALFGEPGSGKFEFVITGRHLTVRCDGDSVEGAAFGGPIFYGHQAGPSGNEKPDHPGNVYWYQAQRANEVFRALSGKQRELALVSENSRPERATETVTYRRKGEKLAGLPVSEMSRDQRELVEKVLGDLLLPYRKRDTDEAMRYIKSAGGVQALSMSFYKNQDIGNDGVWDVWQLESPNMIWYFRGQPHVHVWVNIRKGES